MMNIDELTKNLCDRSAALEREDRIFLIMNQYERFKSEAKEILVKDC